VPQGGAVAAIIALQRIAAHRSAAAITAAQRNHRTVASAADRAAAFWQSDLGQRIAGDHVRQSAVVKQHLKNGLQDPPPKASWHAMFRWLTARMDVDPVADERSKDAPATSTAMQAQAQATRQPLSACSLPSTSSPGVDT
jgi:hypothetical protein